MRIEVISLGGSLFIQDDINCKFLRQFKKLLMGFHDRKFVIVAGGGKVARLYIDALRKERLQQESLAYAGIAVTRMNAKFLANFFVKKQHYPIPRSNKEVKNLLKKHDLVFCGALRYEPDMTSDGTAAHIASYLKTRFINMTNVKGAYTRDPKKYRDAKFIKRISFREFDELAGKIRYKPGQHFVLDQHAAKIIRKGKIKTYIVGSNLKNLHSLLRDEKFIGTVIE